LKAFAGGVDRFFVLALLRLRIAPFACNVAISIHGFTLLKLLYGLIDNVMVGET
jgi:hypothetical protein